MVTKNTIVLFYVIILSFACYMLLRYEWKRLSLAKEGKENVPGWLIAYGVVMTIVQIALVFVLDYFYPDNSLCHTLLRLGLISILWICAATDYKYKTIPNDVVIAGLGLRIAVLIVELFTERDTLVANLITEGIAIAVIVVGITICLLLMKNSIGMGDLKMLMIMALCQGIGGIISSVFLAMCISFVVAVVLLIAKKKTRKDTLPFGPCMLLGTIAGVFLTGM